MRFRSIFNHAHTENLHFLLGKYKYEPLPSDTSIRLLELLPSPNKKIVHCSLKPFELRAAPTFSAISYTWGDPSTPIPRSSASSAARRSQLGVYHSTNIQKELRKAVQERGRDVGGSRRHSIICNGQIIKVTSNLRDALRMLVRSMTEQGTPTVPRYFWIDALWVSSRYK